jgi:hypothetical protein
LCNCLIEELDIPTGTVCLRVCSPCCWSQSSQFVTMEKKKKNASIYMEEVGSNIAERNLVEWCTKREFYVTALRNLVSAVKEKRRKPSEKCEIETLSLMVLVRECTLRMVEAIEVWQSAFTKVRRPHMLETDYLMRMISSTDFVNGSHLRRKYYFRLDRGNIFLLPRGSGKEKEQVVREVSEELSRNMVLFSTPPQERIVAAYQTLLNTLKDDEYASVVPLDEYLAKPYVPKIFVKPLPPGASSGASVASTGSSVIASPYAASKPAPAPPTQALGVAIPRSPDKKEQGAKFALSPDAKSPELPAPLNRAGSSVRAPGVAEDAAVGPRKGSGLFSPGSSAAAMTRKGSGFGSPIPTGSRRGGDLGRSVPPCPILSPLRTGQAVSEACNTGSLREWYARNADKDDNIFDDDEDSIHTMDFAYK